MYHGTLEQGQVYIVKLRGRYIKARFVNAHRLGQFGNRREVTRYLFNNLETGREITLKSKVKIIRVFTQSLDGVIPQAETRE